MIRLTFRNGQHLENDRDVFAVSFQSRDRYADSTDEVVFRCTEEIELRRLSLSTIRHTKKSIETKAREHNVRHCRLQFRVLASRPLAETLK